MKLLSAATLILVAGLSTQTFQDYEIPAPSPHSEIWLEHIQRSVGEELTSDGVPERYHYLYSLHQQADDATIRGTLPFVKIALSRTACLGECPVYEIEFSNTGKAIYNGIAHTRIGERKGLISLHDFGHIAWAIERLELTEPQAKPKGEIRDTAVTKITITLKSGETVEVTDHGFPTQIELLLAASLIDQTSDEIEWE